jgi:hypothetical protein
MTKLVEANWNAIAAVKSAPLLSTSYISQLRVPTETNESHAMLFRVNGGKTCTSANIPAAQTLKGELIGSTPKDLYAMLGALQQNNFIIARLHMEVTWMGRWATRQPTSPACSARRGRPRTSTTTSSDC